MLQLVLAALSVGFIEPQAPLRQRSSSAPMVIDADEARTRVGRAAQWLVTKQNPNGSWGTGANDSVQFEFSRSRPTTRSARANARLMSLTTLEESPLRKAALERSKGSRPRACPSAATPGTSIARAALYGFQATVAAARDPGSPPSPEGPRRSARAGVLRAAGTTKSRSAAGLKGRWSRSAPRGRPRSPRRASCRRRAWSARLADRRAVTQRAARYPSCWLPNGAYTYDPAGALIGGGRSTTSGRSGASGV